MAQHRVGVAVAVQRPHAAARGRGLAGPGCCCDACDAGPGLRVAPSSFSRPRFLGSSRDSARPPFWRAVGGATAPVAFVLSRALWHPRAVSALCRRASTRAAPAPVLAAAAVCVFVRCRAFRATPASPGDKPKPTSRFVPTQTCRPSSPSPATLRLRSAPSNSGPSSSASCSAWRGHAGAVGVGRGGAERRGRRPAPLLS